MWKIRNWNPTIVLWAGNATLWPLLALLVTYRFGLLDLGAGWPKVQSLAPVPIRLSAQVPEGGARNPFDPDGSPWRATLASATRASGDLRGVIIMPGFSVALTAGGVVHLGEEMVGGSLKEIQEDKVIVQRGAETLQMELGSTSHPASQGSDASPRSRSAAAGEPAR
jgi:hypothetical protein